MNIVENFIVGCIILSLVILCFCIIFIPLIIWAMAGMVVSQLPIYCFIQVVWVIVCGYFAFKQAGE